MSPAIPSTTVLVVDDEPGILQLCVGHLADIAARVLTAPDGPRALQILAKASVDVLLTDYSMPGMSGADLLELVRETYPQTVQILFTGLGDCRIPEQATRRGKLFRFLVKPFDRETLREATVAALAARQGWGGRGADVAPVVAGDPSALPATAPQIRSGLEAYIRQAWFAPNRRQATGQALERLLGIGPPGRKSGER